MNIYVRRKVVKEQVVVRRFGEGRDFRRKSIYSGGGLV